jgi:hypothetical protein
VAYASASLADAEKIIVGSLYENPLIYLSSTTRFPSGLSTQARKRGDITDAKGSLVEREHNLVSAR